MKLKMKEKKVNLLLKIEFNKDNPVLDTIKESLPRLNNIIVNNKLLNLKEGNSIFYSELESSSKHSLLRNKRKYTLDNAQYIIKLENIETDVSTNSKLEFESKSGN